MRIGNNPEKTASNLVVENYHRIVIPVYIPNFEGYFEQAFEVFRLCLESILLTIHEKTRITIYNNNSNDIIKNYLDSKYEESKFIDQVFHSKENLGKINAILAAVKGNLEPIVTITDADVLFKHNWQSEVEVILKNFPQAGMVSPVPSSIAFNNRTANNWIYALFRGKLFFGSVIDPLGLQRLDDSLGNEIKFYKKVHLEKYLILKNKSNNQEAVMGCGHFVATIRREVFDKGTAEPAFIKIQKGVEGKFIDLPNEELGFLRLATKNNLAYHMGNRTEKWMYEEFELLKTIKPNVSIDYNDLKSSIRFNFIQMKIGRLISRILAKKTFRDIFFKYKGLSNSEITEY
ncbi:glycosyltransferase family A protein [Flavobacterium sp.]|uniref:glycosyltransferase family A protein n=1 Tax=Flavobacterium sp. TaxID=239 RepID=UPI00375170AA